MPVDDEIEELVRHLVRLEDEIERKLEARRDRFKYRLEEKRAIFDEAVLRAHREIRTGLLVFIHDAPLATVLVSPVVYGLFVPIALLDIGVTVFQYVCFAVWGLERVRRSDHVVLDRHRLAYLNGIEKLNCIYCGYANGVIAFANEVASRTEQFWCPIKHARRLRAPHRRYRGFLDYGDAAGFRARLDALRDEVRKRPER